MICVTFVTHDMWHGDLWHSVTLICDTVQKHIMADNLLLSRNALFLKQVVLYGLSYFIFIGLIYWMYV